MVDINNFIMYYVLTTVLDRLDVMDNFFFLSVTVISLEIVTELIKEFRNCN